MLSGADPTIAIGVVALKDHSGFLLLAEDDVALRAKLTLFPGLVTDLTHGVAVDLLPVEAFFVLDGPFLVVDVLDLASGAHVALGAVPTPARNLVLQAHAVVMVSPVKTIL